MKSIFRFCAESAAEHSGLEESGCFVVRNIGKVKWRRLLGQVYKQ
jgi:hypothetical protein